MNESLTVTIDHQITSVKPNQTILSAARDAGIYIPRLCSYEGLPPFGACRLCIVEVEGMRGYPTACSTPITNGMVIATNTPILQQLRASVLELILSEHPSNCILCEESKECNLYMATIRKGDAATGCRSCPEDGNCELQQAVQYIGVKSLPLPNFYKGKPVEKFDPFYNRDYNLCILCGRCVQVCHSIRHADILAFIKRGRETFIGPAFNRTHAEAGCEFCGDCVNVCPTGTLSEKTRRFSTPSVNEHQTSCPFCSLGCDIILQTSKSQVIGSLPAYSQTGERSELCTLGRFGVFETVNHRSRVKHPLLICENNQKSISWQESVSIVADKLKSIKPDEFVMLISPDCTTEDLVSAQKFSQNVIHSDQVYSLSNNYYSHLIDLPDKNRFSPSDVSTLSKNDIVLCIGVDQRYYQSNVSLEIKKASIKGCQVVLIQPGRTNLDRFASLILPIEATHILPVIAFLSNQQAESNIKSSPSVEPYYEDMQKIKTMMSMADRVVLVIGELYLENEFNRLMYDWILNLTQYMDIRYLLIPQSANLMTALRLGIARFSYPTQLRTLQLRFAYLVGVQPPTQHRLADFIVYQNFVPPKKTSIADLILPSPAFSEEKGSFMSLDGKIHHLNPAMKSLHESLPAWKVLSLIAQELGVKDFATDEENTSDLYKQLNDQSPRFHQPNAADHLLNPNEHLHPVIQMNLQKPVFRGFSIQEWVGGLQDLPPLKTY